MFKFKTLPPAGSSWPIAVFLVVLSLSGGVKSFGYGGGGGSSIGLNTGVTFIEDATGTDTSLFAFTSDFNFAIQSEQLASFNWATISVNGNSVYITLLNNLTLTTTLTSLPSTTLDFITTLKSNFLQNLAGLTLDYASITKQPAGSGAAARKGAYGNSYQANLNPSAGAGSYSFNGGPGYGRNKYGGTSSAVEPFNGNTVLNYYNLYTSPLGSALNGDVYLFDLNGNILDVFTLSVSISSSPNLSILYYDETFYAYSCPNMALNINRIFVDGIYVFFIYNDGSIIIKPTTVLNPIELNIVIQSAVVVKNLIQYSTNAAAVNNGFTGTNTTTTTTSTTSTTTTTTSTTTTTTTPAPSTTTTTTTTTTAAPTDPSAGQFTSGASQATQALSAILSALTNGFGSLAAGATNGTVTNDPVGTSSAAFANLQAVLTSLLNQTGSSNNPISQLTPQIQSVASQIGSMLNPSGNSGSPSTMRSVGNNVGNVQQLLRQMNLINRARSGSFDFDDSSSSSAARGGDSSMTSAGGHSNANFNQF